MNAQPDTPTLCNYQQLPDFHWRESEPSLFELAKERRDVALDALWHRFRREAEGLSLKARMRLSHTYQAHIDAVEKQYRHEIWGRSI